MMQADIVRDYMRDTAPLGAALTASVEEVTPEEEEEEEEEEEGDDEEEGIVSTTILYKLVMHQSIYNFLLSAHSCFPTLL